MKYQLLVLVSFTFAVSNAHAKDFEFSKKKGFFGYTRACMEDISTNHDHGGCVTSFVPLFFGDLTSAPTEALVSITDAISKSDSNTTKEQQLVQKLSLFAQIADDAREYIATQTTSPLLVSAVMAINATDLTEGSRRLLQLEGELIQVMQTGAVQ
jgi:hypothetical protein